MDVSWEEDALFGGYEEVQVDEGMPDGGAETELLEMIYRAMEVVKAENGGGEKRTIDNRTDVALRSDRSTGINGEEYPKQAVRALGGGGGRGVDVAEVFSPERVTTQARKMGLVPGLAMDLQTGWDFRLERHKEAARRYVDEVKPMLVIGSPMCKMFSTLQNLFKHKRDDAWHQRYLEAEVHSKFVVELYKMQLKGGRLFLHEHPHGASSWALEWMTKLAEEEGVEVSVADQCQYGLRTWGDKRKVKDRPARNKNKIYD
jgi:hypothetical protein